MLFNILGETLAELAPPFGYAYDVTFSPDSELLAVGFHGGHLVLYDARSGERVRELKGHGGVPNGVRKLRFSPDGKLLASASSDRTLRIWDVKKRKQLQEHAEPADVNGLDWFPDGQRLAFCTDTSVGIYDLKKQKRVAQAAKSGSADVLVIDGGERVLADGCATKLGVLIFDAKLKLQQQLKQRDACRLRLGADGVLTVASWQGKDCGVSRWELRKRRRTQLVGHEDSAVWALDVSPRTGELAAAGDHGMVHRWDAGGDPLTTAGAAGHTKEIERLALAPAGDRLYSASSDGAVIAWELPAGRALATYHIKGSSGTEGVALSADGRTLYAAGFSGIAAFDLGSGEPLWQRKTDRVRRVLPLDEQTLVVTLGSRLVWVDARSGEALHSGRPTGGWSVHFVERLRDGRLVTGQFLGDHELALWDPAEREAAGLFEVTIAGTHGLYDMIQLADGRLLLSCADKTLRLVDERVTREETILSSKHTFDRIAISPGGAQLAATAGAELTLMRFPDLEVVQHIQLPFAVSALRFLDEGQLVAGGKNGQLYRVRLQARPGGINPMPHV
jgi:WD40 repeat protein